MSITNDRKVVAWAVGVSLPRLHAILDEATTDVPTPMVRMGEPIERIGAPGVIVGWGTYTPAPSTYAPSLPAVVEMLIPSSQAEGGELLEHSQWRARGAEHVGWAVTEAQRTGPWEQFATPSSVLAAHGLRWMQEPDVDDPTFEQWAADLEAARAAQAGAYTLTESELLELDVLLDTFYAQVGMDSHALRKAHGMGLGRARLLQRMMTTENAEVI